MKKLFGLVFALVFAAAVAPHAPISAGAVTFEQAQVQAQAQAETAAVVLTRYASADTVGISTASRGSASETCVEGMSYYFISSAQADEIAREIAADAVLRETQLADGRRTVNISVDFEQGRNLALLNNRVLRRTAKELVEAQNAAVREGEEYALMDKIHIVGETELHLIGYQAAKGLGGASDSSPLNGIYNSCRVADLNVDEARMGGFIRLFGVLLAGVG